MKKLSSRTSVRLRRALRHLKPQHIVRSRITRRVIDTFADKAGLVYFGSVDQRDEGRRLVRGHTVSATHIDNHYCVGTVRGYDVVLLLRNDVVRSVSGKEQRCHWLIFTVDLHTTDDIPHCYIGHQNRESQYRAAYTQLRPLPSSGTATYPAQFRSNYTLYGQISQTLAIEAIISPEIATVIATHFQGASVEIEDGTVYLYVESAYPKEALLEKMLSNALWLAEQIDERLSPRLSLK